MPLLSTVRSSVLRSEYAWLAQGARVSRADKLQSGTEGPRAPTSPPRAAPPKCRRAGASTTGLASGPRCASKARSPSRPLTVSPASLTFSFDRLCRVTLEVTGSAPYPLQIEGSAARGREAFARFMGSVFFASGKCAEHKFTLGSNLGS